MLNGNMKRLVQSAAAVPSLCREGGALYRENRFGEALACYEAALAAQPDSVDALHGKGFLLKDLGRLEEARDCLARAAQLAPGAASVRLNLGLVQLKLGEWDAGWENYEARWAGSAESLAGKFERPRCPLPQWNGEGDTNGLRLLILTEQGFGDVFQFSRYLPLAAERFAQVGFLCSPPTLRLLEWSFGEEVAFFTYMAADFSTWDLQCPMMSLPRAFGTRVHNVPTRSPYLRVPTPALARWRDRLDRHVPGCLRVGIAWAGRPVHQYDAHRTIGFERIEPLLQNDRVAWVNLQKWTATEVRPAIPKTIQWVDWTEGLVDFADTAALVANLDLVISVDSAV